MSRLKQLVRLRHVSHAQGRPEAFEIVLINSHDGASCYQIKRRLAAFTKEGLQTPGPIPVS